MRGAEATIRWGYHPAVRLGAWAVEGPPTTRMLTGTVKESDEFRVQQQPLTFVVSRPQGSAWCWPVETLQIAGDQLTAKLGPQE